MTDNKVIILYKVKTNYKVETFYRGQFFTKQTKIFQVIRFKNLCYNVTKREGGWGLRDIFLIRSFPALPFFN